MKPDLLNQPLRLPNGSVLPDRLDLIGISGGTC